MRDHGIGSWTARRARKTPHRTALVHGTPGTSRAARPQDDRRPVRRTYAQFHDRTTRLAHHLRSLGVRRGDRVAFLGPNHPAFLETLFATARLGAVFVPLNTRLAVPELAHCLADSGAGVLVHTPGCAGNAEAASSAEPAPSAGRSATAPPAGVPSVSVRHLLPAGDAAYEKLLEGAAGTPLDDPADEGLDEPIDEPVAPEDLALIMYTSGTTGAAKGAALSHANLTWNAVNVLVDSDLASDEVTLLSAPLFHTAALNMTCLPGFLKGGTLVLEESFDPARTLALVEELRVTSMFGVPAMFQRLAEEPGFGTADLSSVRRLMCGGSPVPRPLIRTYEERGLSFIQGYGMTEASPGVLLLDAESALSKSGSAGLPHFFTDVRVLGPDGEDVRPGERGELSVEGPNVMSGYWERPEASAAVLSDGWFRTGDVVTADEDGYVTVVDRVKDMIISGGENIYPAEVEGALLRHPAVADCAVIGVPDERWGETGRAVVVRAPGAETTAEALLASLDGVLARYKIPKSLVFAEELPRSAAGKLLKPRIRDLHGNPEPTPASPPTPTSTPKPTSHSNSTPHSNATPTPTSTGEHS